MAAKPFNVRMEPELREAIDRFVAADGARNASVWSREALAGVVALGGLGRLREAIDAATDGVVPLSPHPRRSMSLQAAQAATHRASGACTHPLTARERLPFTTVCRLCGATLGTR